MTATDNKSYLGYLNKLVDECNKSYHCFIDKKPIYATLTEETENKVIKFLNLKLAIESKYFLPKYFKQLLLSKLWMTYYSEPDSYIKNKTKGVLDLPNYDTEKKNRNGYI